MRATSDTSCFCSTRRACRHSRTAPSVAPTIHSSVPCCGARSGIRSAHRRWIRSASSGLRCASSRANPTNRSSPWCWRGSTARSGPISSPKRGRECSRKSNECSGRASEIRRGPTVFARHTPTRSSGSQRRQTVWPGSIRSPPRIRWQASRFATLPDGTSSRVCSSSARQVPSLAMSSRRSGTRRADGRRRAFIAGAGRPNAETKRDYFRRYFGDARLNEDWASGSLGEFNALEHESLTLPYLGPALDSLPFIQAHRRIFFLEAWLAAFLRGQTSDSALGIVRQYLAQHPRLPLDLRRKVLQHVDELDRTVRIRSIEPETRSSRPRRP